MALKRKVVITVAKKVMKKFTFSIDLKCYILQVTKGVVAPTRGQRGRSPPQC